MTKKAEYHSQKGFVPDNAPVFHGYFTRKGGFSTGGFAALNCGPGSDEDIKIVQQNRDIVAQEAGVGPARLVSVHQEHGVTCVTVKEPWPLDFRPKADAMVTDVPGIVHRFCCGA
jgi:polyphenol oxidase